MATFEPNRLNGVAASSATAVVVGRYGVLYSGEISDQSISWTQLESQVVSELRDVAYDGSSVWVAVGDTGVIMRSEDGEAWGLVTSGVNTNLYGVTYTGTYWVAVGKDGVILQSGDGGLTWASKTSGTSEDLRGVANYSAVVVAVGIAGAVVKSTDGGGTWAAQSSGVSDDFYAVDNNDAFFVIVGDDVVLNYNSGTDAFTSPTVESSQNLRCVVTDGANNWIAAGEGGALMTSDDESLNWIDVESGFEGGFYGAEYSGAVFILVGDEGLVGTTGGIDVPPDFDVLLPVSDIYRWNDVVVTGGVVLYIGERTWDDTAKEWVTNPRRIRWAEFGTYKTFTGVTTGFLDLPRGTGQLLTGAAIGQNVILQESDKVSLLTPGTSSVFAYYDLADKLRLISRVVAMNQNAFGVGSDGLLYRINSNEARRMDSGFDLTVYDDWAEDDPDPVWIRASEHLQALLIFRPSSPYRIHVVDNEDGAHTVVDLPSVTISGTVYSPAAIETASTPSGERLFIGYRAASGSVANLVVAEMDFGSAVTGVDEPSSGQTVRWSATLKTGLLQIAQPEKKAVVREIMVRTYCEEGASIVPPDLAIEVRGSDDTDTRSLLETGTITVGTSSCTGVGTCFSNVIVSAFDGTDLTWDTPCRASKINRLIVDDGTSRVKFNANEWSVSGAKEVTLAPVLFTGLTLLDTTVTGSWGGDTAKSRCGYFISANGTPDKFDFSYNGTVLATGLDMTATEALSAGPTLNFSATTGHTIGDGIDVLLAAYGSDIVANWHGRPYPSAKVGYMVRTDYGYHRVTSITDYKTLVLAWYPAVQSTGVLVPAQQLEKGEGELHFGVHAEVDELEITMTLVPRNDENAATNVRLKSVTLTLGDTGEEVGDD